jgi:hypothetical protein
MEKMRNDGKKSQILIRVQKKRLEKNMQRKKSHADRLNHTASVENRILDNERRQILTFIEKQDNVFIKIETNINQIARIANGQKFISE